MTLKNLRVFAAFVFFGFAPILLIGLFGVAWSQSNALATVPLVADPQVTLQERIIARLAKTDDFVRYKKLSAQVMEGQNETLRGVSELTSIANSNLRQAIIYLLISTVVLYLVALFATLRLLRKSPD